MDRELQYKPLILIEGCGYHVNEYLWPRLEPYVRKGAISLCVTDVHDEPPTGSPR